MEEMIKYSADEAAYLMVNAIVPYFLFLMQLHLAFAGRIRYEKKKTRLLVSGMFGLLVLFNVLILLLPEQGLSHCYYIGNYIAVPMAACFILYYCTLQEEIFVFLISKCYMDDIFTIAKIVQVYVIRDMLHMSDRGNFIFAYTVVVIVTFPVICLFMKKWMRRLIDITPSMSFWTYIWLVPFCFYFIYKLGISPDYATTSQVWAHTQVLLPVSWIFSTFLVYCIIVKMLVAVTEAMQEKDRLRTYSMQIAVMEQQYEKVRDNIEEIRRMNHDMRHELLLFEGMLEQKDYGGLEQYVKSQLKYQSGLTEAFPVCENYAVDAIAGYYLGEAKKHGIHVNSRFLLPKDFGAAEKDICIILGNLLENALEACLRQSDTETRFIKVNAGIKGSREIVLIVKNSYCGTIQKKGSIYFSSKRSGEGIGISSVQAIAEKYKGIAKFEYGEHIFTVSLMLYL